MFNYAITIVGDAASHLWANWDDVLVGATAISLVAHAVNSFPPPENKYGAWALGVIQFAVGLRYKGMNTIHGDDSRTINIGKSGTGDGK